jgi:hypothetical protein
MHLHERPSRPLQIGQPRKRPRRVSLESPPGTYYVSCAAPINNTPMFWDVKVDLKPGANSLTLDNRNTEPV